MDGMDEWLARKAPEPPNRTGPNWGVIVAILFSLAVWAAFAYAATNFVLEMVK